MRFYLFIYLESQIYEYYTFDNKYAYFIVVTSRFFFFLDNSIADQLNYKTFDIFLLTFQTKPTTKGSERGKTPLDYKSITGQIISSKFNY